MADDLDTSQIKTWRSIVTLIVFVVTNIIVLFPFTIPVYMPRTFWHAYLDILSSLRVISPRQKLSRSSSGSADSHDQDSVRDPAVIRLNFPMNFITAPLIADLFLLAILAIGRKEVHDGTVGADHIFPIDIMVFFLTLAYIAISLDASGLIRNLAVWVLRKGGENGHLLFFYLYAFFFALASFIGNDPIVLSGTPLLAYMTKMSSNIESPRAWIYAQFAVANVASAILVSSNPTNLVLAGAFKIQFIRYTANVIVPVLVTVIILFPFLLWILFSRHGLIPKSIKLHTLPPEAKDRKPVNPNIPYSRPVKDREAEDLASLEEIMNPYLDKRSAAFGSIIMAATLITILAINAASKSGSKTPAYWVTLPAAFVMFCWDLTYGWLRRHETRTIAQEGRRKLNEFRTEEQSENEKPIELPDAAHAQGAIVASSVDAEFKPHHDISCRYPLTESLTEGEAKVEVQQELDGVSCDPKARPNIQDLETNGQLRTEEIPPGAQNDTHSDAPAGRSTLVSLSKGAWSWSRETFPTVTTVLAHLPFKLVPFALCMFVLVQALVTKGWVAVFAYGWDDWIKRTGTVGAVGGMGFLGVVLCNFAGTNIGTTILLCRVIQAWVEIHARSGKPITERTFWATVYSMAIGVNYGAFSTAFSASLAGLLWRDILARKGIVVSGVEFARVNLPIIALSMVIGSAVLIGEVYIIRDKSPYSAG